MLRSISLILEKLGLAGGVVHCKCVAPAPKFHCFFK
jgi:hypothetical protein